MDKLKSRDIQAYLKRAVQLHRSGHVPDAKAIYDAILDVDSNHAEALHLSGVAAYQSGDFSTAVERIEKAIQQDNSVAAWHSNLGNAYLDSGGVKRAVSHYQRAIDLAPDHAQAYLGLGNAYCRLEDWQRAVDHFAVAALKFPNMDQVHNNLGVALEKMHRRADAVKAFRHAVTVNPSSIDARMNLGHTLKCTGAHDEALEQYRRVISLNGVCAEAYAAMGGIYQAIGEMYKAEGCLRKALELDSKITGGWNDLGTVYLNLGQVRDAKRCFEKALSQQPDDAVICNNFGSCNRLLGNLDEAVYWYRHAIDKKPDFAEAYFNLGNVLERKKAIDEAILSYRKAIKINPEDVRVSSQLLRQLQHACLFDEAQHAAGRLLALTKTDASGDNRKAIPPFLAFSISGDPQFNLSVSQAWCRDVYNKIKPIRLSEARIRASNRQENPICIGYLSADFKNHATAHLMRRLFQVHDKSRFRIHAYSYGIDDKSDYRQQIAAGCDSFFDIREVSHLDAARKIANDDVDILVDLKGHTQDNRLEICAYRPAPVQVTYLGFPGTSGAPFIDYIIGDAVVTPSFHSKHFTEKIVRLPDCYQVNDDSQEISSKEMSRSLFGLPDDGFVFCSFNEPYKIEPAIFDIWMSLLRRVPGSVLWLIETFEITKKQLKMEAEKRGVAANRLLFAPKIEKQYHLARIRCADLCLDTKTVNGHTTTSDALWAGVPVVTIVGTHFASRVSASLLRAVGLSELITESLPDYEALSMELALNSEKLISFRKYLLENAKTSALFDTVRFVKNLEEAYVRIWHRHLSDKPPCDIDMTNVKYDL
jgi:protein O-GlcNAc transferase